jgi:hypothetical protein
MCCESVGHQLQVRDVEIAFRWWPHSQWDAKYSYANHLASPIHTFCDPHGLAGFGEINIMRQCELTSYS